MRSVFFLTILPLLASATTPLLARSDCPSGSVACGSVCIPQGYTCCPDNLGGCSADETCQKGSNGVYGCCAAGAYCTGPGSTNEIDSKAQASVSSSSSTASSTAALATASSTGAATKDTVATAAMALAMVGGLVQLL